MYDISDENEHTIADCCIYVVCERKIRAYDWKYIYN